VHVRPGMAPQLRQRTGRRARRFTETPWKYMSAPENVVITNAATSCIDMLPIDSGFSAALGVSHSRRPRPRP